jgi:O-antigen ligase
VLGTGAAEQNEVTGPLVSRLVSIGDQGERANIERLETWAWGLALAEQYPVLGVGLANTYQAVQDRRGAYTHNTYLDVLVETGPLGLLGLLALLGWGLITAWHVARHGATPGLQIFGVGAVGALLALATIFFFDDAFYIPRTGQTFWLFLGLIAAARQCGASASGAVRGVKEGVRSEGAARAARSDPTDPSTPPAPTASLAPRGAQRP